MKNVLKYLGAVLFVTLMLTKASAFHIYEHHDSLNDQETPCELCILSIDNQQTDILFCPILSLVENIELPVYQGNLISFDLQLDKGPMKTSLFSRPPPSLLC